MHFHTEAKHEDHMNSWGLDELRPALVAAGGHQGSWAQSAGVAWEGLCPAKWYIFPEQGDSAPQLAVSWCLSSSLARPLALLPPAQTLQSLQTPSVPCSPARQEGWPCPLARHAKATHAYLIGAGVPAHTQCSQCLGAPCTSHTAPAGGRVCTPLLIALFKPETWKATSPCLLTQPPPTTQTQAYWAAVFCSPWMCSLPFIPNKHPKDQVSTLCSWAKASLCADKVLLEYGHAVSFANCLWLPSGKDGTVESTAYKTKTNTSLGLYRKSWRTSALVGGRRRGQQAGIATPSLSPRVYPFSPLHCPQCIRNEFTNTQTGHITTCSEPSQDCLLSQSPKSFTAPQTRASASSLPPCLCFSFIYLLLHFAVNLWTCCFSALNSHSQSILRST